MQTLLEMLLKHRDRCSQLSSNLSQKFGCDLGEPPLDAFGMYFNTTTLVAETCSYFLEVWTRMDAEGVRVSSKQRDEAKQRVIMLTKVLFVFGLSSLEHSAKAATEKYPAAIPLDKTKKWQYLSNILGKSHALGIINADAKAKWDGILKLRNTIVHNNGIASEDLNISYPNGAVIEMTSGAMTIGDILLFARLMDWATENYADWSQAFLQRAGFPIA